MATNGNVTEILNTNATFFTFAQGTGASNGWGTSTPSPLTISSATYETSIVAGNTCAIAWSGRALYLNPVIKSNFGPFSVTLDTAVLNTRYDTSRTQAFNSGAQSGVSYQNLLALHRYNPGVAYPGTSNNGIWQDGAHTTTLAITQNTYQSGTGNLGIGIDSAFMISGQRMRSNRGTYIALGDSISDAYGAYSRDSAFTYRTAEWIAQQRREDVNYVQPGGIASACTFTAGFAGSSVLGGQYRLFSVAAANAPEFLVIAYGANDLRQKFGGSSAADFARNYYNMLAFIEDVFDVTTMAVVVCSPFPMSPIILATQYQSAGSSVGIEPMGIDNYEAAIMTQKQVVSMFPWCRYADMYGAMSRRNDMIYPNNQGDYGIHLNDSGHGVAHAVLINALQQPVTYGYNPFPPGGGGGVRLF